LTGKIGANELPPDEPAPALDSLLYAEQFRLTRDGLVNTTAYLVSSIAGMVLIPVLFAGLSREVYGIWIAALAVQYSTAFLTGGIGRGVAHEVAMGTAGKRSDFVAIATIAYALIGLAGGLVIASAGLPLASGLKVSAQNLATAHLIFCFIGIGFAGDQLQSLGLEILTGLRKFVTINAITTVSVLVRTAGVILVFKLGGNVVALAGFHAALCVAVGATAYVQSIRTAPHFGPRLIKVQWENVRRQFGFSVASQLTAGATSVLWRSAPFLLGFLNGPAAIVPYELGGKFPMSVSSISWQAADVLFPAASEYHGEQHHSKTRQLLDVGTRGILLFALPLCIALFVLAPMLLGTWIKGSSSDAVRVLRLTTIAVLLDSAATASIQVIWGYGRVRTASLITFLSAAVGVASALLMVPFLGAPGAASGIATGVCLSSVLFIVAAGKVTGLNPARILKPAGKTLTIPAILEMAFFLICIRLYRGTSWIYLTSFVTTGLAVYAAAFYAWSANPVEKKIAAGVFVSFSSGLYNFYRNFRSILERVPLFRTAILYAVETKNTLLDSSERSRKAVKRLYIDQEDPFGFNRELEQFRFERAIDFVRRAGNGTRFPRVFEIGCAEGMFTRFLAPYAESLVAVDLSPIAVERAQRACGDLANVQFSEWDVRRDPIKGPFDLIVATGVLEYILRPSTLRDTKDRIAAGLSPRGYLLLGNTVTIEDIESTWIGKKLIRGALVNDFFANDPRFEVIASSVDQCVRPFSHVLLRRRN
jgi:O-antigen/teichoic acid export membrane protein/SAM-dependent methyltransferase